MCVATEFALVGFDTFTNKARAEEVRMRLIESGRDVIDLTNQQINEFAGNAIELSGRDGRLLALSRRAFNSLTAEQRQRIERSARLVPLDVPTIEMAGGSVRCMIAGIHLSLANRAQRELSRLRLQRLDPSPPSPITTGFIAAYPGHFRRRVALPRAPPARPTNKNETPT
jgi:hypothetical protein